MSSKSDSWPVIEIKPLERMRMGRTAKDVQEVTMMLRPHPALSLLDDLRPPRQKQFVSIDAAASTGEDQLADVLAENKRLRASLDKAVKINDKMWTGIVDLHLLPKGDQLNASEA